MGWEGRGVKKGGVRGGQGNFYIIILYYWTPAKGQIKCRLLINGRA